MANKVTVVDSEYSDLVAGLNSIHMEYLDQFLHIYFEIKDINYKGGDFYSDLLTPKIDEMLDEFYSIWGNMSQLFSAHVNIVRNFQVVVNDYDS